jgi:hypothetical protein
VQCPKDEDPKAAQITLKNAMRKSLHVEIAKLYFQLEDVGSAEREARTACVLNGDEAGLSKCST